MLVQGYMKVVTTLHALRIPHPQRSFFTAQGRNDLSDFYVHDAPVTVSDGSREVALTDICSQSLTPPSFPRRLLFLSFHPGTLEFQICVYIDPASLSTGEIGKT